MWLPHTRETEKYRSLTSNGHPEQNWVLVSKGKEERITLERQLDAYAKSIRNSVTLAKVRKQSRLLGRSHDVIKDPEMSHLSILLFIALASV